ncbi:glycosyltransferase [Niallia taxi]|uniref:glycosyltransferase n=1 Tax=Niallia taxi TaxID=2499688 RepID=UPI0021A8FCA3|nr:glycosyltransferase [Niallia taxi]MCT2347455.1 glycosyltransferase [Niallia taxi]
MEKKKIAIFLPSLSGGGAEKMMVNIAKGFSENGIHVDLVLGNAKGPYMSMVPKEVSIVDLKSTRLLLSLSKLARYLKNEKPQSLLVTLESSSVIALLAKIMSRVSTKLVVRIPNNMSQQMKNAKNAKHKIILRLATILYKKADGIIAISEGVAKDTAKVTGIPIEKIEVIYNPVVTDELIIKSMEQVNHTWFNSEVPTIIGVGRLSKQKDFPILIEAFSKVIQKRDARLVIIGEGEEQESLNKLVKDLEITKFVDFIGFVDNPYKFMEKSSLFVLSSAWEGFGNVIVEAMACGTPIVSTDCKSGPSEILDNGNFGKLVPVGDSERMASAIIESLESSINPEIIKERAEEFRLDAIKKQYLKMLI